MTRDLCVQCMHIGPYDDRAGDSARRWMRLRQSRGMCRILRQARLHHEIYLGDPRRTAPEKLKTVLRHPVREKIKTGKSTKDVAFVWQMCYTDNICRHII